MDNINLTADSWEDYELLDSGNNRKLKRYGSVIVARPKLRRYGNRNTRKSGTRPRLNSAGPKAKARGTRNKELAEKWDLNWKDVRFALRLTSFKHTGVFPEQAPNWGWLRKCIDPDKKPNILNLFGYTGIASIVAAKAGAKVTHLDASKQSNSWAKENAVMSGSPQDGIRYILDDAVKFVKREVRRGSSYDGILLDPPAFGRGPKGEVWKIEDDLPELLRRP